MKYYMILWDVGHLGWTDIWANFPNTVLLPNVFIYCLFNIVTLSSKCCWNEMHSYIVERCVGMYQGSFKQSIIRVILLYKIMTWLLVYGFKLAALCMEMHNFPGLLLLSFYLFIQKINGAATIRPLSAIVQGGTVKKDVWVLYFSFIM